MSDLPPDLSQLAQFGFRDPTEMPADLQALRGGGAPAAGAPPSAASAGAGQPAWSTGNIADDQALMDFVNGKSTFDPKAAAAEAPTPAAAPAGAPAGSAASPMPGVAPLPPLPAGVKPVYNPVQLQQDIFRASQGGPLAQEQFQALQKVQDRLHEGYMLYSDGIERPYPGGPKDPANAAIVAAGPAAGQAAGAAASHPEKVYNPDLNAMVMSRPLPNGQMQPLTDARGNPVVTDNLNLGQQQEQMKEVNAAADKAHQYQQYAQDFTNFYNKIPLTGRGAATTKDFLNLGQEIAKLGGFEMDPRLSEGLGAQQAADYVGQMLVAAASHDLSAKLAMQGINWIRQVKMSPESSDDAIRYIKQVIDTNAQLGLDRQRFYQQYYAGPGQYKYDAPTQFDQTYTPQSYALMTREIPGTKQFPTPATMELLRQGKVTPERFDAALQMPGAAKMVTPGQAGGMTMPQPTTQQIVTGPQVPAQ